jgi:hypothetical protein
MMRIATRAFAMLAGLVTPVHSEIHDYMILRLLYLGTSCGVQKLERLDAERPEWRRFKAECRDVSAYPHGLLVTCTDPDDDRHCTIETQPNEFDSLELLRPQGD